MPTPCFAEPMRCDRRIRALPCPCCASPSCAIAMPRFAMPSRRFALRFVALAARSCADLAAALRGLTKRCHSNATLACAAAVPRNAVPCHRLARLCTAAASPFLAAALLRQPMRLPRHALRCHCAAFPRHCRATLGEALRCVPMPSHRTSKPCLCTATPSHCSSERCHALAVRGCAAPSGPVQCHRPSAVCPSPAACPAAPCPRA